jgi:hypothetical protein
MSQTLSSWMVDSGLSTEVFSGSIKTEQQNLLRSVRVLSIYCGCSSSGRASFLQKT